MRIVILGAGRVGYSIAKYLATEENDITVIDKDSQILSKVADQLDIRPILGKASYPSVLAQADIENSDLIVAVTGSDEVNMIACDIAHSMFNVKTKIARVREKSYADAHIDFFSHPEQKSIDHIISPENEVAMALYRSLQISGANDVISLFNDSIKLIGIRCPSRAPALNTPLRLLPSLFPDIDITVITIQRDGEFFIPDEDSILIPGDLAHVVVRSDAIQKVMEALGHYTNNIQEITIIGAGNIGLRLAQEIEHQHFSSQLKLVEKDRIRSEEAARHLVKAQVINGDALELEILNETNVQNCGILVSVTDDDKVNILSSLLAKQMGAGRTITLLNNISYSGLVTSLGADAVINPRSITVSSILKYIRQGRTNSVYTFGEGKAEIIEAEVRETSHIIGLSVEDVTIKRAIFIAAIQRGSETILLPRKQIIGVGDHIIMVTRKDNIHKVEKLFSTRPRFL